MMLFRLAVVNGGGIRDGEINLRRSVLPVHVEIPLVVVLVQRLEYAELVAGCGFGSVGDLILVWFIVWLADYHARKKIKGPHS